MVHVEILVLEPDAAELGSSSSRIEAALRSSDVATSVFGTIERLKLAVDTGGADHAVRWLVISRRVVQELGSVVALDELLTQRRHGRQAVVGLVPAGESRPDEAAVQVVLLRGGVDVRAIQSAAKPSSGGATNATGISPSDDPDEPPFVPEGLAIVLDILSFLL